MTTNATASRTCPTCGAVNDDPCIRQYGEGSRVYHRDRPLGNRRCEGGCREGVFTLASGEGVCAGCYRPNGTLYCRAQVPLIGTAIQRGRCLEIADYRWANGTPVCDAHYRGADGAINRPNRR